MSEIPNAIHSHLEIMRDLREQLKENQRVMKESSANLRRIEQDLNYKFFVMLKTNLLEESSNVTGESSKFTEEFKSILEESSNVTGESSKSLEEYSKLLKDLSKVYFSTNQEEKQATAVRFEEFWSIYPKRQGKKPCLLKWEAHGLDAIADKIIADVKARAASHKSWLDGYIPMPLTYINQERWEDEIESVGGGSGHNPYAGAL